MELLNQPNKNDSERRVCGRTNFLRQIIIKLADGSQIKGSTCDISLGGISLEIESLPTNIEIGQSAELHNY